MKRLATSSARAPWPPRHAPAAAFARPPRRGASTSVACPHPPGGSNPVGGGGSLSLAAASFSRGRRARIRFSTRARLASSSSRPHASGRTSAPTTRSVPPVASCDAETFTFVVATFSGASHPPGGAYPSGACRSGPRWGTPGASSPLTQPRSRRDIAHRRACVARCASRHSRPQYSASPHLAHRKCGRFAFGGSSARHTTHRPSIVAATGGRGAREAPCRLL